jgi:hypothetical protein
VRIHSADEIAMDPPWLLYLIHHEQSWPGQQMVSRLFVGWRSSKATDTLQELQPANNIASFIQNKH